VPDGTHVGTGRGYTWLGLSGTNGSPGLQLPRKITVQGIRTSAYINLIAGRPDCHARPFGLSCRTMRNQVLDLVLNGMPSD
jgi:hypothetical protein